MMCRKLGWARIGNNELIVAAEKAGFELMVSSDQNITYQQKLSKGSIVAKDFREAIPVLIEGRS